MTLLDQIAEARIAEAMQAGMFEDLPGQGRPLTLDDDRHVPETLRVAYRILKNSGLLPSELSLMGEVNEVRVLLSRCAEADRPGLTKQLNYLRLRLGQECRIDAVLNEEPDYFCKLTHGLAPSQRR